MSLRLQTSMDDDVLNKVQAIFRQYGLSLNEGVKVLLNNFANGKIELNISANDVEYITLNAEKKREVKKDLKQLKKGIGVLTAKESADFVKKYVL